MTFTETELQEIERDKRAIVKELLERLSYKSPEEIEAIAEEMAKRRAALRRQ